MQEIEAETPDGIMELLMQAVANVISTDVPGALLVLSVAINVVLLAPYIGRRIWRKTGG